MPVSSGLNVERLAVNAGDIKILRNLGFSLYRGELCAVIGPSGAGKSTLIKTLLGLRSPDNGDVTLDAGPVSAAGPIGYVPQDDAVHRTLTVRQTLEFAIELRRHGMESQPAKRLITSIASRLSLSERLDTQVRRLSGGQRKRVSVALELVTNPPLLILDEPTSGLDPHLEGQLMSLFADIAHAGRMVMVATHAMQSLSRCDALLILAAGQLVYFGPPGDAPEHFQVGGYAEIFGALARDSADHWARIYSSSPTRRAFAERDRPPSESDSVTVEGRVTFEHPSLRKPDA
jgi:ABC transport system ATP-binding/permease protein